MPSDQKASKNICIIPARGGSKRIPKKNIKLFCGKPLIAYSIENALKSELFEAVIVSTDSEKIANVAKEYGAKVRMRPKELADDFTGTGAVVKHVLEELKKEGKVYDFCCTLYATAPLLQVEYLKKGLEALKANSDAHMAFSVASMPFPIWRTFKITKEKRCEMFFPEHFSTRSQDLEEAYQDAGQFYWDNLRNKATDIAFGKSSIPVVLPRYLVQDIDTMEDWERAEKLYKIINPNEFDNWNEVKQNLNSKKQIIGFNVGDVLFVSVGQNVGFETYGKGEEFLRPVVVIKKFGKDSFYGVPLSTNNKEGYFYYTFSYKEGVKSTALLSQVRLFDAKRVKYRSGYLKKRDFEKLIERVLEVITPLPKGRGSD